MDQNSHNRDPLLASKIVGTLCLTGLVFLFARWGAEALTSRGLPPEHHGEESSEELTQAYTIQVAATDTANDAGGAQGPDFGALMQNADVAKGETVFKKCQACHSLEAGKNGTGPSLNAVVGRQPGTEAGYTYDEAMIQFGQEHSAWTPELLFTFLADPKAEVPGTKMSFAGIKDDQQRADLVAFLMGDQYNAADFSAAAPSDAAITQTQSSPAANNAAGAGTPEKAAAANLASATAAAADIGAGDPAKGEQVFKKCKACHSNEKDKNGTGPSLFGVVGRQPGTEPGYEYDEAMIGFGQINQAWTTELLNTFIENPKKEVPGTKMSFAGVKKPDQRADLIAYLSTLQ